MALTQRGINIPVTGQFQDGDDIVDALIAQGLSVDAALGSAISEAQQGMVGSGNGVRRILVSTDPNEPLQDGDLLLVLAAGSLTVTPPPPTFDDAADTYTIPAAAGVIYRVGGVDKAAGTYSVTAPTSVTVTAHPMAGYTLEGDTSWNFTYTWSLFTDFSEGITDWTARWNHTGSWSANAVPAATGGMVAATAAASSARRCLTWDTADAQDLTDVEVVARIRSEVATSDSGFGGGLIIRASGAESASASGYQVGINSDVAYLAKTVSGTFTALRNKAFVAAANEWYWVRLRAEGNAIKAKIWLDSEDEPSSWELEITDTSLPSAGWVGLFGTRDDLQEWDVFSVAIDGGPAPKTAPGA